MCSGAAFIIGLILLFKGNTRLFERNLPAPKVRVIGMILMAPFIIAVCAGFTLVSAVIDENTTLTIWSVHRMQNVTMIEYGALALAVLLAAYNIFTLPKEAPLTAPPSQRFSFDTPPSVGEVPKIMTVEEVALYLRVSPDEVLRLINEGKLGAARIGSTYRIARIAVEDFMARKE
ncbi:helix-turn-helix domain-containing protein [Candidatus Flexifilum breve]|uniref:helix-turn-helix domain-containing protein n=1 Tax=Candidatus Flexifilum breve TaxID=3140694 RepID=UPI0031CC50F7